MKITESDTSKEFEIKCGLTIAVFAAVLAITDLYAGKYGDDEIKMTNEKSSAFMWYQSKSIKETVTEGQRDLLNTLVMSGSIATGHLEAIKEKITRLASDARKYEREKKEILLGSANVGQTGWSQEINGEKGKIIGAQEWDTMAAHMGKVGDQLDIATLFLQICLVFGAISLVLQKRQTQVLFYSLMITFGATGTGFTIYGLLLA